MSVWTYPLPASPYSPSFAEGESFLPCAEGVGEYPEGGRGWWLRVTLL